MRQRLGGRTNEGGLEVARDAGHLGERVAAGDGSAFGGCQPGRAEHGVALGQGSSVDCVGGALGKTYFPEPLAKSLDVLENPEMAPKTGMAEEGPFCAALDQLHSVPNAQNTPTVANRFPVPVRRSFKKTETMRSWSVFSEPVEMVYCPNLFWDLLTKPLNTSLLSRMAILPVMLRETDRREIYWELSVLGTITHWWESVQTLCWAEVAVGYVRAD